MAVWHVMFGMGIGLVFTIGLTLMTIAARQQEHRARPKLTTYLSSPEEQCAICLFNMTNDEMVYINCGHAFHDACLRNLRAHRDHKCPTCRQKYD